MICVEYKMVQSAVRGIILGDKRKNVQGKKKSLE